MDDPLLQIAALDPMRNSILVSHGAERKWHTYPCSCGEAVYLRQVGTNEVVFECDSGGFEGQRSEIVRFISYLRRLGAEPLVAWSGSKSFHVYVWFDPLTAFVGIDNDPDLADIFDATRKTIWKAMIAGSATTLTFDPSNVRFSVKHKGRMVRWAGSIKPDAPEGTTPFTFLNEGIPETRPTSLSFEPPRTIPKAWDIPMWLREEIRRAVKWAQEDETERRERQVEVTDPMIKVFIEAYAKDWKRLVPMWRYWFEKGAIWPSGQNYRRATMCVRAMAALGMTREEIEGELELLKVHVGYGGDDPKDTKAREAYFETWYASIDADMKNPLTEIDGEVFQKAEAVLERRRRYKKAYDAGVLV